uniref:Uncharacterized protein n=1 Tax=Steinernema glaseri TaxID=37863 RepID=A0A1I7ZTE7_9BILA
MARLEANDISGGLRSAPAPPRGCRWAHNNVSGALSDASRAHRERPNRRRAEGAQLDKLISGRGDDDDIPMLELPSGDE